ncbi:hypothetical protein [Actinophytocola xanthii]|uniref:Sulfotransferase family protein n=1 Tax=Actinophytocola xanthii TaxID=1912961 RepID=A0A1Q8CM99_9PSEU|nr:hypothetical protein [Actinophytocola xanthii]OLF15488.1 hypothetical protein BU204_21420 [Actinophytocola xanthii]
MAEPTRRVYLHVGTPKSGTTYLQEVLWRNREPLAVAGVLYPGDRPDRQFLATLDLLGLTFHGHSDPDVPGSWDRLAEQVRAWPGTSVVSHEMLAPADERTAARALASFGDAEVHLVCTARDLARQLPAVWQEDVKNRGQLTFAEFSRSLRGLDEDTDPYHARTFWGYQDVPAVLRTWSAGLPPDRVHVLPLPRGAAAGALWSRFARVLGVDPALGEDEDEVRNPSTGVVETTLLRLLNSAGVADDLPWPAYESLVKTFLAVEVLASRPGSVPLTLPAGDRDWVRRWSEQAVAALRRAGYDVVGDLADLLPADGEERRETHPDGADPAELADAAVYALAATLRLVERERARFAEEQARSAEEHERVVEELRRAGLREVLARRHGHAPRVRWMLDRYRGARSRLRALTGARRSAGGHQPGRPAEGGGDHEPLQHRHG